LRAGAPAQPPETYPTRRTILRGIGAGVVMAALPAAAQTRVLNGAVPKRTLGRTGLQVSIIGLGGHHIARARDAELAVRLVRMAIDHGITFLDNCWDYNDGKSEEWMGRALKNGYRDKAFLMTKLDGRTRASAAEQLEQSLRRLQTDRIDLVQIHEVIRPDDAARCFSKGGAIEALLAAQKAGKLRFIGFTGHKDPAFHLGMLETARTHGFTFDTVQMPLNVMDAHYQSFEKQVLPVLSERNIGVLGMKSMGDGIILSSKVVSARECLRYALSLPTSTVITGCDSVPILEQAIDVATHFSPLSAAERAELLQRTAPLAQGGKFELFKSSDRFDGTSRNPKWLRSSEL
jgi:aryl-alcohol dehydrogenase-like predicted oxidoreductase